MLHHRLHNFLAMLSLVAFTVSCGPQQTAVEAIPRLSKAIEGKSRRAREKVTSRSRPFTGTVWQAVSRGCSTRMVRGLSEQIIAESNCMAPGSYARVPKLANMTFSTAVFPYLTQPARDALVNAARKGRRMSMRVNSMLRTVAQQYLLHRWYQQNRCGISLAAAPGKSNHQSGLSIDVSQPRRWRKQLRRHGFRWLGKRDRWHFDFRGQSPRVRKGLDVKAFQRLWNRNYAHEPLSEDGDFGPSTAGALRRSPAAGFPIGPTCRG